MATAGSADRPGSPASAAATAASGRSLPGSGTQAAGFGFCSAEDTGKRCTACAEGQPGGGSPPCGHPAGWLCPARTHSGGEERLRRRSDPERSGSRTARRACDSRKEFFVAPLHVLKCSDISSGPTTKHRVLTCEDRDDIRRRNIFVCKDECGPFRRDDEPGVLSDSENEEPISRRIRTISAFIRKTKTSSAASSGSQRSRSCTDPVEERGGKLRVVLQPALTDRVGISHSFTAGILLSSENSRCVSAPIMPPERRLAWRAVVTSSSTPLAPPHPERSISPESNDSISEELNHFKPIVCSPCTPPKRLPDGRLLEPTIVKSTPRNLSGGGLQRNTSYEASPAVLQKWRQIELDRQSLKVSSRATLTSPVNEIHETATKSWTGRDGDATLSTSQRRRLLFDGPGPDHDVLRPAPKIRVPAIRYRSETSIRGVESIRGAESGGEDLFSKKQSFSPYAKNSGLQFVPKDSQGPAHNQSTSKRKQKTKHLDPDSDPDLKRSRTLSGDGAQVQQDRALAIRLQRQFDLENQAARTRTSPDKYRLRSWMSNQNRRRRGLRRSRRITKKH